MVTLPLRYPLDPTGVNPDNKIVGEIHTLPNRTVRAVAPGYGSFFDESVVVRDVATGLPLVKGVQFVSTEMLEFPTGRYGKEIDGIILIKDSTVSSNIEIDYQTLGGAYSTNSDAIIAMLNSANLDDRPVAWGDIIGKPDAFVPAMHYHDIGDIYGFEYVVHAIERVREAILIGDDASHDQIYRYIDSTFAQLDTHITTVETNLNAHVANQANPHVVTKTQVGLGNVDNFATATTAQGQAGTATNLFMTPATTAAAITAQAGGALAAHLADHANPHVVTATQVGLGNVPNYALASTAMAQTGTDNQSFMTPQLTAAAITAQIGTAFNAHIANINNPHNTTKTQVGLGSVDNFATATVAQAQAGTATNLFVTPAGVAGAINSQVGTQLTAHLADVGNPHQTTKAQVGLGSVVNYPVSTTALAQAGTDDASYMTPLKTAQAITAQIGTAFNAHINNLSNPHQTTATQVGLGNVSNFATATPSNAVDSSNNSTFMTPQQTYNAMTNYGPTKTGGGASGSWAIAITGNAATATTAANSNALNGLASSTAATANTIAARNGSGQLYATYFNQAGTVEAFTPSSVFVSNGSDGYIRQVSLATFQASLSPGSGFTSTTWWVKDVSGLIRQHIEYTTTAQGNITIPYLFSFTGQYWKPMVSIFDNSGHNNPDQVMISVLSFAAGSCSVNVGVNGGSTSRTYTIIVEPTGK